MIGGNAGQANGTRRRHRNEEKGEEGSQDG
jgi:hypothetical protein